MLRLVALASLVALALLAAPGMVGLLLEHQAGRELARLQANQPGLRVSRSEFHRGWWHSDSRQVLVVDSGRRLAQAGWAAGSSAPRVELEVVSRHRHGPFPGRGGGAALAHIDSQFTLGDSAGSARVSGSARSRLAFRGGIDSRVSVRPLAVDFTESYGGLDLFGGEFTLAVDRAYREWVIEGQLPGGELRSVEGSIALDDGRLSLRARRQTRADHWQAELRLETARLRAWSRRAPRGQTFARQLTLDLDSVRLEDRLGLAVTARAATFSLLGRESRGLSAHLDVEGLSLAAFRALTSGGRAEGPPLLATGGRVVLDPVRAELHYGPLEGSLLLEMGPRTSTDPTGTGKPWPLPDQATLHTRWRLPAGLVALAQRQAVLTETVLALRELQVLASSGDDSYQVDARYRDGQLTINGVDLSLPIGALTADAVSPPEGRILP